MAYTSHYLFHVNQNLGFMDRIKYCCKNYSLQPNLFEPEENIRNTLFWDPLQNEKPLKCDGIHFFWVKVYSKLLLDMFWYGNGVLRNSSLNITLIRQQICQPKSRPYLFPWSIQNDIKGATKPPQTTLTRESSLVNGCNNL